MRMTAISPRNSLATRLDDLLATRFTLQSRHHRITCAADLPVPLERIVQRLARRCEWRAFGVAGEVFTTVARARREARTACAAGALEVYLLDTLGMVYSACLWEHDSKRGWWRGWWLDSVLDLSYDCDHGWWLADLMATERAVVEGAARHSARQPERLLESSPRAPR